MGKDDFQLLADLLKKRSGLTLTEDKTYLIESRLLPVARGHQFQDIPELCAALRRQPEESLLVEITEAMTTNESSFFRDIKPYEQLRQTILPMLMESLPAKKHIRIWSAACSTGQEPYSIAICLQENTATMPGWHFDIVGTDLACKVLEKARQGIYSQFEAQRGLPIHMLVKYFAPLPDTSWQIGQQMKAMVQFQRQNLLEEYTALGVFDLIFCRNVLIYFDDEIKVQITGKMARSLAPHGILMLGATETLVDPQGLFRPIDEIRGAYRLKVPD